LYAKYTLLVRDRKVGGNLQDVTGKLPFLLSYIMTNAWCNR